MPLYMTWTSASMFFSFFLHETLDVPPLVEQVGSRSRRVVLGGCVNTGVMGFSAGGYQDQRSSGVGRRDRVLVVPISCLVSTNQVRNANFLRCSEVGLYVNRKVNIPEVFSPTSYFVLLSVFEKKQDFIELCVLNYFSR